MKAIHNCTLYDVRSKSILENITILWKNGIIFDVCENKQVPEDTEVIDGEGLFVTPGLIHTFSQVGLREYGLRWAGDDSSETSEFIQPNLSVVDGINPFDEAFNVARKFGVTIAHVAPGPENVISGKTAIIKTDGTIVDEMIIDSEHGLSVSFGEIPKRSYNAKHKTRLTRMRIAQTIRDYIRKALYDGENCEAKSIFKKIIEKKVPLYIRAHRSDDIATAIRLKKEFNIDIVIVHGTESFKLVEQLNSANIPVIAGPFYSPKSREELKHLHPSTGKKLHEGNVKYTLMSQAIRNVSLEGALSVREGLDVLTALRSLTLDAAEILGIDEKYGSIEIGKVANIVLWDNPPLELTTNVKETISHGVTVYKRESV